MLNLQASTHNDLIGDVKEWVSEWRICDGERNGRGPVGHWVDEDVDTRNMILDSQFKEFAKKPFECEATWLPKTLDQ